VVISTFLSVVFIILSGYCLLAGRVRRWLKDHKSIGLMNKISGASLIGAGAITATLQQKN